MVIVFDKQLTPDTVDDLIQRIENTQDDDITIYISSEGGYVYSSRILTDYLINKSLVKSIAVIAAGYIDSCAFEMLINLNKCPYVRVAVLAGTTATVHTYSVKVDDNKIGRPNIQKKIANINKANNELLKNFRLGILDQIRFLDGEDICFDTDEITQILKNE